MKIGISFIVFNRVAKLLEALQSCKNLKKDNTQIYINCVFSLLDFEGNESNKDIVKVFDLLIEYKEKGFIDHLIVSEEYTELEKRNIGLKDCINKECDYYLSLDCDEILSEKIYNSFQYLLMNNINKSYCILVNDKNEITYFVPFINKLYKNSIHKSIKNEILETNPDREIYNKGIKDKIYVCKFEHIKHYTNIEKQLKNW